MFSIVTNITCLYCFQTFKTTEIEYRCANPACRGRTPDHVFARARGIRNAPTLGRTFRPGNFHWSRLVFRFNGPPAVHCEICSRETRVQVCPNCHFELALEAGMLDDHIIAIFGGENVGKSIYITTLVNRLKTEMRADAGITIEAVDAEVEQRYKDNYYTPLYVNREVIPPTHSGAMEAQAKTPLIFRLRIKKGSTRRTTHLVFFDTAGEDLQSMEILPLYARYLCYASGIILLVDPLQIDNVRDLLGENGLPPRNPSADPIHMLERLRELYEGALSLSSTARLKIPVAVTLTKLDEVRRFASPGVALQARPEFAGYLNPEDRRMVHQEVGRLFLDWFGPSFDRTVEHTFSRYNYFGISSLGRAPVGKKIHRISPLRVEDPMLWILGQLKLVR